MATAWRRLGTPVVANGLAIPYATLVASYPAASYSGYEAYCSDLGANGTRMVSNGTRWRPVNGETTLKTVAAAQTGITSAETIVLQSLIPAGAWQVNDTIRIWLAATKSGTTDSGLLSVRVGTAGTTADTAITTLSAYTLMAAAGVAGGSISDIKLVSATTAQRLGTSSGATGTYQTASGSGAAAAATTISDASTNALYVSVTLKSSAANDTVGVQSGQIKLITP